MKFKDYLITALSFLKQHKKRNCIIKAFHLRSQYGIEVGGPSGLFGLKGAFPVYIFAKNIDGVNYSNETIWEGSIREGRSYRYFKGKVGHQYIAEATELNFLPDQKYDFLLSCHSLEHVANPIKALLEWKRILKQKGTLVLVLPDKRYTFDINRPYSTLEHLVDDFNKNIDEHDTTHFREIIEKHDPAKDPGMKPTDKVEELLKNNYINRLAHHHVFSQELVVKLLEYCGFSIDSQFEMEPFHLITIAKRND